MRPILKVMAYTMLASLAAVSPARADTISITGGLLTLPSLDGTAPMTLSGTDGVRAFTFDGFISHEAAIDLYGCRPCASPTSIDITEAADADGHVTYGSESYATGTGAMDTEGTMGFEISAGLTLLPTPVSASQRFTFSTPFTASGRLFPPVIPGGLGSALTGSGIATVMLAADSSVQPTGWKFLSATYRFNQGSGGPAPVPEPASFLLLASGLSALVASRRRSRSV